MNTIATNIRFSKDDYEELRQLAFLSKVSIASLVRDSIKHYKKSLTASKLTRRTLFSKIVDSSVKINTSITNIAQEGRKFE